MSAPNSFLTLLLFVLFPAAALAQDPYAGIHTVGIVSAIGDRLEFADTGFSWTGGDGPAAADIGAWNIDQWTVQQIANALGNRFVVQPVQVNLAPLYSCNGRQQCETVMPRGGDVDAYIIAFKAVAADPLGGRSDIRGIGLYHHPGFLGVGEIDSVYAIYAIAVVDAKTGTIIDYGTARLDDEHAFGEHFNPIERVPDSIWPDSPPQLSAEQQLTVRNAAKRLIATTVHHALANANIVK